MKAKWLISLISAFLLGSGWSFAWAQGLVKVTPLGSHTGEFCANDRALLFEDPTGLRILYDPGRSVAGGTDERLGTVHVMILTSVHSDHIGDVKASGVNAGTCAAPGTTPVAPNSNFAEIAALKNSTVIVGGEMHTYLSAKIGDAGGVLVGCPTVVDLTVANSPANPRTCILRHGGKRIVHLGSADGVQIAVVRADHSNGVPNVISPNDLSLLTDPTLKTGLAADNLTAYVGPENGYVLTFTNGLVVYLSGDTGHTGDMATIVNEYYKTDLAVMHMEQISRNGAQRGRLCREETYKAQVCDRGTRQ